MAIYPTMSNEGEQVNLPADAKRYLLLIPTVSLTWLLAIYAMPGFAPSGISIGTPLWPLSGTMIKNNLLNFKMADF